MTADSPLKPGRMLAWTVLLIIWKTWNPQSTFKTTQAPSTTNCIITSYRVRQGSILSCLIYNSTHIKFGHALWWERSILLKWKARIYPPLETSEMLLLQCRIVLCWKWALLSWVTGLYTYMGSGDWGSLHCFPLWQDKNPSILLPAYGPGLGRRKRSSPNTRQLGTTRNHPDKDRSIW